MGKQPPLRVLAAKSLGDKALKTKRRQKPDEVEVVCEICKQAFKTVPRRYLGALRINKTCSRKCAIALSSRKYNT